MNGILEAIGSRIKTPYFGYALLALVGLNWRAAFLLFSTKGSPVARLNAFDGESSIWTLVVWPLVIGVAVALATPWIRYGFEYVSRRAVELYEDLELKGEDRKIRLKARLEGARLREVGEVEEQLIERAKRDDGLNEEIVNQEVLARLQAELQELRNLQRGEREPSSQPPHLADDLSLHEAFLLSGAAKGDGLISISQSLSGAHIKAGVRDLGVQKEGQFMKYKIAIDSLMEKGLIRDETRSPNLIVRPGYMYYALTRAGLERAERIVI